MWWSRPRSDAARREEIARLKAKRDAMLERAPEAFAIRRVLLPVMYVFVLALFTVSLIRHPEQASPGLIGVGTCLFLLFGWAMWKVWLHKPAPGDRWGYSDTLGYDGDGPRDVQRKIDAMEAELKSKSKE